MKRAKKLIKRFKFIQTLLQEWRLLAIAPGAAVLAIALSWAGLTQSLELTFLDQSFRLRPWEPPDPRIVIVTISDTDITKLEHWPISDETLAKLLHKLDSWQVRAIGLDIYRDLPVEPGHQALVQAFQTMPNVIGIEKQLGTRHVPASATLAQLNQVALADIVEDRDGTVRRGLLSAAASQDQIQLSLGVVVALRYLEAKQITLEAIEGSEKLKLGRAIFEPFNSNDGGYIRADNGGYQVLLNFRGPQKNFYAVSITDILEDKVPIDFLRDRIVFIGSTAESTNDYFRTPYDNGRTIRSPRTPGVLIHANLASQILSAALDGRPFIRVLPDPLEGLWALAWSILGALISWRMLQSNGLGSPQLIYIGVTIGILLTGGGLIAISYLLFLKNWWIPFVPALIGLLTAASANLVLHSQRLQQLAYSDGLTQVANRRCFEKRLASQSQVPGYLSLLLCDVDFFKKYNDTYGHQAGDLCLQQVASALRCAVRRSDLVARYGGEEFAVILPHADPGVAAKIADRIVRQVRELRLPHASSTINDYVTLSCGVVSLKIDAQLLRNTTWSHASLVAQADEALYKAKEQGRDRFIVCSQSHGL
jgi:adenylate cyclase